MIQRKLKITISMGNALDRSHKQSVPDVVITYSRPSIRMRITLEKRTTKHSQLLILKNNVFGGY